MPAASLDTRVVRAPCSDGTTAPLELIGVAKAFGPRLLFKGVNLRVEAGEVSLLVGPNGAGKSTLMRIMAGLSRPDAGRVNCALTPEQTGYLGHATFIYPGLSAWENLAFCPWWASAATLTTGPGYFRGAWPSASIWPACFCSGPVCCFWTSRAPAWTSLHGPCCAIWYATRGPRARPWCGSAMIRPRTRIWPTVCCIWKTEP